MKTQNTDSEANNNKTNRAVFIGVDISKDELVADLPEGLRTKKRDVKGIAELIDRLPVNAHVICEATGGYEKSLVKALHQAGKKVSVVMAWRARAYAISQGIMAKNDSIDASVLSRYGRNTEKLRETRPSAPAVERLRELMRARDALIELIKLETNHREHAGDIEMLATHASQRIATYQEQKKQLEKAIREHIKQDAQMSQRAERCLQIKGVGEVMVWTLLCELPELGTMEKGQPAHLLGVAPLCKQSGKHDGLRYIQGGRGRPRRVFYMAALSAAQHNPILRAFYERLVARGKARKVALVAVMRKLVELINKILAEPDFSLAT
ncbi:MAG: IS110 family transposase [Spirochaetaceae bacterium]|nr:IS110 family transposase [Spirochaetaceae bacterium]